MKQSIRYLLAILMIGVIALAGAVTSDVGAQDDDGFPIGVVAAMCPEEYAGPFVGCEPWVGAEISVVSDDGAVDELCVTPEAPAAARTTGCDYVVPFGSTITATLMSDIPDGWVLSSAEAQSVEIPGSPPDGVFGGPTFVLQPADNAAEPGDDQDDVTELPSTGRGSIVDAADSGELATQQMIQTVMILATAVSVAFGSLVLFARRKGL